MIRLVAPLVTVVVLLSAVLAAPAFAQGVREGKMRLVGRATVEAVPDYVTVQVGISNRAASPTAALDQNSAVARKIIDFSKGFGVAERDIQTSSVNLAPNYKTVRDPNGTTRQEPDGYNASNMIRVKLGDLSRLGAFMRQILDQGATNIAGVHFGVTNLEKLSDEARTKAVEDAVRQAQGPGTGCQGEARADPGHCLSSAQPVQRDGWRGRHAAARGGQNRRSHRGRNHQDQCRGRNHLGHRVRRSGSCWIEARAMSPEVRVRPEPSAFALSTSGRKP